MESVMFLISSFNIGGTEKALINMLEIMDKDKYEVDIYVLEKKGGFLSELPDWINLYEITEYPRIAPLILNIPINIVMDLLKKGRFFLAIKLAFTHLLYKLSDDRSSYYNVVLKEMENINKKYDVSIAYTGPFDFVTMFILKKVNAKRKIQWIHFDISKFKFNEKFAKKNYKNFNEIITVSEGSAEQLIKILPELKNKIKVIHNFVPQKKCFQKAEEFSPFNENELRSKFIILTVGRLTAEKGQIIIPKIVKKLLNRGLNNFIWYIVGDGLLMNKIKKSISENQVDEYIKMVGEISNPFPYYKNADLYVQTSLHEGYCLTIAEAKMFDKYIISTDVVGAYEQIKRKEQGEIVKYDEEQLANAILSFFRNKNKDRMLL